MPGGCPGCCYLYNQTHPSHYTHITNTSLPLHSQHKHILPLHSQHKHIHPIKLTTQTHLFHYTHNTNTFIPLHSQHKHAHPITLTTQTHPSHGTHSINTPVPLYSQHKHTEKSPLDNSGSALHEKGFQAATQNPSATVSQSYLLPRTLNNNMFITHVQALVSHILPFSARFDDMLLSQC